MGKLHWFNWVGMLHWLELACPTACTCLFEVRPGVLSKTLSHICSKLNLPIFLFNVGIKLRPGVLSKTLSHISDKFNLPKFLFNVGLFTIINIDSLIFLA